MTAKYYSDKFDLEQHRSLIMELGEDDYHRYRIMNIAAYESVLREILQRDEKSWQDRYILRQAGVWTEEQIDNLIDDLTTASSVVAENQSLFPGWSWYNNPSERAVSDGEGGVLLWTNKRIFWSSISILIFSLTAILAETFIKR